MTAEQVSSISPFLQGRPQGCVELVVSEWCSIPPPETHTPRSRHQTIMFRKALTGHKLDHGISGKEKDRHSPNWLVFDHLRLTLTSPCRNCRSDQCRTLVTSSVKVSTTTFDFLNKRKKHTKQIAQKVTLCGSFIFKVLCMWLRMTGFMATAWTG